MASPGRQGARSVGPARPNPSRSQPFPGLPSARRRRPARPPPAAPGPGLARVCPPGAQGPGRPGGRGAGSVGSCWAAPAEPLPLPLLAGRPGAAPSLSSPPPPPPCPPGLVVLNISQLRYRTVELLRTTGPGARSASAALRGEEPRRPRPARPPARRSDAGRPPSPASPAVPAARPLRPPPRVALRARPGGGGGGPRPAL